MEKDWGGGVNIEKLQKGNYLEGRGIEPRKMLGENATFHCICNCFFHRIVIQFLPVVSTVVEVALRGVASTGKVTHKIFQKVKIFGMVKEKGKDFGD